MKFAHFVSLGLLAAVGFACSNGSDSEADAVNKFDGKKVGHWYETLTLDRSVDNSFIKYHQDRKDLLLGNRNEILPETLKGLWFMDGNPIGDQTFNLSATKAGRNDQEDFYFEVNTPSTFSWTNIKANHDMIGTIAAVKFSYSFQFLDCPADVKLEREKTWGMADGSCTKADKQFAIITPMVTGPFGQIRVPPSVAYFDMYLRPKTDDFLVWERRSKVFAVARAMVNNLTSIFRQSTKTSDYHRYRFTQVLDGDGQVLSSMSRLVANVETIAATNKKELKDFIFYVCYEGAVGCSRQALADEGGLNIEGANITDFGAIPLL
jgi:hypothetical protein